MSDGVDEEMCVQNLSNLSSWKKWLNKHGDNVNKCGVYVEKCGDYADKCGDYVQKCEDYVDKCVKKTGVKIMWDV